MSLWEECGGVTHIHSLAVTPWRVVETQEKSYTRKLVSSSEELDILEDLIEKNKPKIDKSIQGYYHYLLFSPFRYPPLKHGSRFGRIFEPSLWYGALKVETALREVAYYRLLFLHDTEANLKLNIPLSAYSVKAASKKSIDLTQKPFADFYKKISSPVSYEYSQPLGTAMRKDSVELFLYYSARTTLLEKNVGIFYPRVFTDKKPLQEPLGWNCYADKTVVEFRPISRSGKKENLIYYLEEFLQDGSLNYASSSN